MVTPSERRRGAAHHRRVRSARDLCLAQRLVLDDNVSNIFIVTQTLLRQEGV